MTPRVCLQVDTVQTGMKVEMKKVLKGRNTEFCAELLEKIQLCPSEISKFFNLTSIQE